MQNEYGVRLDRNGYAPSIIPGHGPGCCCLCGRNGSGDRLDRHEIFPGANRAKSKQLGLWVYLCHRGCHQGPDGVHQSAAKDRQLRQVGQAFAMERYGWDEAEFIRRFGKSYLR